MTAKKRVGKHATATRKVRRIQAADAGKRPVGRPKGRAKYLPEELAGLYKPVKRPVTLRLDADILAWFQRGGRGYQTRINRVLRHIMMEERKGSK